MSVDSFLLSAETTDLNYPEIRPTLDLNFARVKALDPRITFTRSSGGSYVGADGFIKLAGVNEPRFDHDPSTGESLGLLVEEPRTNLVLRSEEFDNASWGKVAASVSSNTIIAPNIATTADSLIEEGTLSSHLIFQYITVGTGTFTASVYIKQNNRSWAQLSFQSGYGLNAWANFDLSNGVVGLKGIGATASIVNAGNGWYRCIITASTAAPTANGGFAIGPLKSDTNSRQPSYTGDGASGLFLWGAQLEAGAFATSYIPTQASTRTRAADVAQITGTNFSSWYNAAGGTVFADTKINGVQTARFDRLWAITNSNLNQDGLGLFIGGSSLNGVYDITATIGGVTQYPEPSGTLDADPITAFNTPRLKSCFGFTIGNTNISYNGRLSNSSGVTITKLLTADRLLIGQPQRFQGHSCMTVSNLKYFPKRLPNEQLQALTR